LASQQKRVLVVDLKGGVSQLESWDPKPNTETGGPFRPIATSVPGVHICELLPYTAQQMHHLAIVRSVNTRENDHGKGKYAMLTGRRQTDPGDYPYIGAVMAKGLEVPDKLIDRYLSDAIEVDVDALSDGKDVFVAGIMEHIEEAGIHSGDSACSLPPHSLSAEKIGELERETTALALALKVGGLMNVQYAIKDGDIYVLEVNPRASRTVPFVAKTIGIPVAKIASRVMAGEKLADFKLGRPSFKHVAVKEAVFPFARFPGVDTVLGPEMRSTGEVMGLDFDFSIAFAKSQIGAGSMLPKTGTVFVSVKDEDKPRILESMRTLAGLGFRIIATSGTLRFLKENGIEADKVNKVLEGRPHIVDAIKNGEVQLVFNTTEGAQALTDSRSLRRAALLHKVPYYTTLSGAIAAARGIKAYLGGDLEVRALQSYFDSRA
jgi:carbamoyl-phosphate synthase large subunit